MKKEYLLASAGLEPRKNQEILLRSFAKNKKLLANFQLVITGYNKMYFEKLKNLASDLQIASQVVFTDSITEDEKNALIQHATLLINPSRFEGFGIPILEAAAFARPILCSDIPAFTEIGKDYAMFFRDDSLEDLTAKLIAFFATREKEDIKAKKTSRVLLDRFTIKAMKEKWRDLVNSIA